MNCTHQPNPIQPKPAPQAHSAHRQCGHHHHTSNTGKKSATAPATLPCNPSARHSPPPSPHGPSPAHGGGVAVGRGGGYPSATHPTTATLAARPLPSREGGRGLGTYGNGRAAAIAIGHLDRVMLLHAIADELKGHFVSSIGGNLVVGETRVTFASIDCPAVIVIRRRWANTQPLPRDRL